MRAQSSYSADQARGLRNQARGAKKDLAHVEEELGHCLDALSDSGADLDSVERRLTSMAQMLRDTSDQLDSQ